MKKHPNSSNHKPALTLFYRLFWSYNKTLICFWWQIVRWLARFRSNYYLLINNSCAVLLLLDA